MTKTNIKVEMASGAANNIKTLAELKEELGEALKIEPIKLTTVTDMQKIMVDCTAYGNRTQKLEFNVKVTKAGIPDMPSPDEIEWNPKEENVSYDETLNSYIVTYDKNAHKLELDEESINKLPQNVKIERYEYKKIKDADGNPVTDSAVIINDGVINAGTYEVKIIFSSLDDNFRAPEDITSPATLTIMRANQVKPILTLDNVNALLGGEAPKITSLGETPNENPAIKYTSSNTKVLTISNNGEITLASVGTAEITVKYEKTENYNEVTSDSVTITVKNNLNNIETLKEVLKIKLPSETSKYDGNAKQVTFTKPEGIGNVTLSYYKEDGTTTDNTINVGKYIVKITVSEGTLFNGVTDMEIGRFEITKRIVTVLPNNQITTYGDIIENSNQFLNGKYTLSGDSILDSDKNKITISLNSSVITDLVEGKVTSNVSGSPYEITAEYNISDDVTRGNYTIDTSAKGTYTVNPKTITDNDISVIVPEDSVYGDDKTKTVTVIPDENDENIGYTITYYKKAKISGEKDEIVSVPENAGTYYAVVVFTGKNNYTGTITKKSSEYKIETAPAEQDPDYKNELPNNLNAIYGQTLNDIKLGLGDKFSFQDDLSTSVGDANAEGNIFKVTYTPTNPNYSIKTDIDVKVIVAKTKYEVDISKLTFAPESADYEEKDGNPVPKGGTFTNLDEGVIAEYEYFDKDNKSLGKGNLPTEVGEYRVKVTFKIDENGKLHKNYDKAVIKGTNTSELEKIFTINKASYILDGANLTYEPIEAVYDGNEHGGNITDTLDGINISYEYFDKYNKSLGKNVKPTKAGTYKVEITFDIEEGGTLASDYDRIQIKDSTSNKLEKAFTINKAVYDMSQISFSTNQIPYDGNPHTPTMIGELPEGVSVKYYNADGKELKEGYTNVGTYTIIAKFEGDSNNYEKIEDKVVTLRIVKSPYILDVSNLIFEPVEVIYNGSEQEGKITNLPAGIEAEYEYFKEESLGKNVKPTKAGEYNVKITFKIKENGVLSENHNEVVINGQDKNEIEKTFKIKKNVYDMSNVKFEDIEVTYDGEKHGNKITGTLPEGVTVRYFTERGNELTEKNPGWDQVGKRLVIAKFTGDTENYELIPDMTAYVTINKAIYNMSNITFNNGEVDYDGNPHTLKVNGNLPSGVNVEYYLKVGENETLLDEDNKWPREVGEYEVIAKFTGDSTNYEPISDMKATLKINRATYELDTSTLTYEPTSGVYTGNEQGGEITNLVEGIEAKYEYFKDGKTLGEGVRPSIVGD
ncbi:MAG: hypothetical protein HFJ50_02675, partial [Clostridia bacterium]|nr:hypothetical protein [Clostridia bacterium]